MVGGYGSLGCGLWEQLRMVCPQFFFVFMVRARWSVWLVSVVLMVASLGWKCAVGGRRRNQWSSGEFVGVNVDVWGSPMWMREVALQNSSRGA